MKYINKNSGIYDEFPNPEAAQPPKLPNNLGCYAVNMPISAIHTDTARFQNRTNAFSELSAQSVAENFDKNKFDPIVVWLDPKQNKYFVLSGHSRLEGMKRRRAKTIPVRFFEGTEAEAIQFARVDANRSANQENLIEDLKAYKLMRDGDHKKGLKPATKSELERTFKGKHNKLELWSYLNPNGLFMQALQSENRSEFPHLETRAMWVGELRKKYGDEFTNTYEDDCFNFIFADVHNNRMSKEDFFELVEKRISWGEDRLFPECANLKCEPVENIKEKGLYGELYKRLNQIQKDLDTIRERLATSKVSMRVYTDPERHALNLVAQKLKDEQKKIKRDLKIQEEAPGLFGDDDLPYFFEKDEIDFSAVKTEMEKLNITENDIIYLIYNPLTRIYGFWEYNFLGFTEKLLPLYGLAVFEKGVLKFLELSKPIEWEFKMIYCNG